MHITTIDEKLLQPGPIRQIRLDLTTRCNLRCVYCSVSHQAYRGIDMDDATVAGAIQIILDLAKHNALEPVDVNGHGETTFRKNWDGICHSLLEKGVKLRITSNFAKAFNAGELEALACMETIAISIDSDDRKLLQKVRRRVDLRQILANIAGVKAAAIKLHRPHPRFEYLCGLYDRNTLDWESFARFAVATTVSHVGIWNLADYPELHISDDERVRPLDDLPDAELKPRIESVLRGLGILSRHRVSFSVHGDFVSTLARRAGIDGELCA